MVQTGLKLLFCPCVTALAVLLALPQHAAPQTFASSLVFTVDPAQSSVHWTLGSSLHTVHGTFALQRGSLQIDPATGKARGEVVVDATSGKSGNDGRDKKMHGEVLESGRFGEIVFRPDSITGKLATQGDSTLQIHGVFMLHGGEHEMTVPIQANVSDGRWTGSAKFSVPFIEWGLKNPSTWLLKVDHSVSVELELKGTVQGQAAQGDSSRSDSLAIFVKEHKEKSSARMGKHGCVQGTRSGR